MNLAQIQETYNERQERLGDIPINYKRDLPSASTASELDIGTHIDEYSVSKTPIWRFAFEHRIILSAKPVSVIISKGQKLFFAENENLALYATGETRQEAIREFCEQLVHFYLHYKKLSWDKVIGEGRRLKTLYNDLFAEIEQ